MANTLSSVKHPTGGDESEVVLEEERMPAAVVAPA
jgi:hypothetical protein